MSARVETGVSHVVEGATAALYLTLTSAFTYLALHPYDGVESNWVDGTPVWLGLVALHLVTGAAIGRWWALALPFVWALVSLLADGYDTPPSVWILFTSSFYFVPALVIGILAQRLPRVARTYSFGVGALAAAGLAFATACLLAVLLRPPS